MAKSKHRKNHTQALEKRHQQHQALQAAINAMRKHPDADPTLMFKEQEEMTTNQFEIKAGGKGTVGLPTVEVPAVEPVPEVPTPANG